MSLQQTAYSACSRKVHCVSKHYLDDPFVAFFSKDTTIVNSPLMNRGTWLRTVAIERSLLSFANEQCGNVPLQVISFGAGVDTLYFRLKKDHSEIQIGKYIELDFPDLVEGKRAVIERTKELKQLVGPEYELVPCDLRKTDELREILKSVVRNDIPTVLLAEMVFVYLEEHITTAILELTLNDVLQKETPTLLIAYDAIRPNDRFGEVMVNSLASMGVPLRGIKDLPTPEAHAERCKKLGFTFVMATSMKQLYLSVPQETQKWLKKLEMVDDWDEWCIMHDHYCFVLAAKGVDVVIGLSGADNVPLTVRKSIHKNYALIKKKYKEMSLDELKAKGNEAFKAKKYEDAVQWYTKAIELSPHSEGSAVLYSNRSASWQNMGNFANALKDAESCIRVKPTWVKGHYRKGFALESMGKPDEALKAFQEASKQDPENVEILDKLQKLVIILKERDEKATPGACKTAEEAKTAGNSMFSAGKFEKAKQFYSRAIELSLEKNTELANCYANRAACYQQTRDYELVIDDCDKALEIDPKHVKALLRRALAYEGLEKWRKALNDYNQANTLFPGMAAVSQGVLRCQRILRS